MVSVRPAPHCTGVDLHPDQCRVVDVEVRARDGVPGDVRVHAFAALAEGRMAPALSSELTRLRQEQRLARDAWVTIWDLNESEIARQIQPLVEAGFNVRGVCTPAMALTALARHHERATSGTAVAYVALESNAMCMAIVRDGVLLFSREIPWEFADSADAVRERLADELSQSLMICRQTFHTVVERVVLCGGMPNLRALTSSTGSALNVPVETLDSLSGIDAEKVPEPADTFRAAVAALWPAIAIASQGGDQPNLLPASTRMQRETRTKMTRIAAGVVASVLILIAWYFFTNSTRDSRASELARLERQVARLESEAQRASAQRAGVQETRPSPAQSPSGAGVGDATPRSREVSPEPDLIVSSILYSSQRRLAIVNGRIVRVGDRIGSSTILYIEPRAVTVQSADGTKRTLELRSQ